MKIAVKNLRNETLREIELPEEVFAYPFKEHLVHTAVRAHLAGLRRGTHKTKVRSEVSGAGKKLWKQKGTGRARVGSLRSPIWRKGGTVHGPQPRDYSMDLTVREKKNALKSVLSRKVADATLIVVDQMSLDSHKTKALSLSLKGLGLEKKALIVDSMGNENLRLAVRNNPHLLAVDALAVNVYEVLYRDHVVVSEAALNTLVEVLTK
jgi:large subunit ribosomal protein L4